MGITPEQLTFLEYSVIGADLSNNSSSSYLNACILERFTRSRLSSRPNVYTASSNDSSSNNSGSGSNGSLVDSMIKFAFPSGAPVLRLIPSDVKKYQGYQEDTEAIPSSSSSSSSRRGSQRYHMAQFTDGNTQPYAVFLTLTERSAAPCSSTSSTSSTSSSDGFIEYMFMLYKRRRAVRKIQRCWLHYRTASSNRSSSNDSNSSSSSSSKNKMNDH